MNATVLYSLQTILSAGVFILIYRLFVRNTNAYNWNRFYLLATMIISLFLPHIDISGWFTVEKPIIFYGSLIDFNQAVTITPGQQVQNPFNLSELIMTGYWIVAIFLLLRFLWGIMRIIELAKNDDYKKSGNLRLYPIQRKTTFSFFNYIFIQPEHWDKPITEFIIRHERAHVEHMHSLDNILTEFILVFGWFNPFYYIYRNDLHLLHECQADQVVINSGCDKSTYHQLLLNEVSGNLTYIIVNQFSYSLIKRRFKMISKNKQSRLAGFRILLAIPTAFALLLLFSFTSMDKTTSLLKNKMQQVQSSLDIFQNTQQKPIVKDTTNSKHPDQEILMKDAGSIDKYYPGGNAAWSNFLKDNYKYPEEMVNGGSQGIIYVSFIVSKTGEIKEPKIYHGIDPTLDQEAFRVISHMPNQEPKLKDGKPISVQYILPVFLNLLIPHTETAITTNEDKLFLVVEQNPEFNGGFEAMLKFLKDNMHYPDVAVKTGVQGTVFVQFVVQKTGKISNIKVLRGIGSGCDEEAVRVVSEMPNWTPGRNKGEVVSVMFQIPVKFQLKATYTPLNEEEKPLLMVEQNPEFQGNYPGLMKYIKDNLQYPPLAQQSGIQGTVFVQFVVNKSGEISKAKVLRGIGGGCDEEAVRIVQAMPKWIPGRQNGQAVSVMYQLPIKFQLAVNK